MFLKKALIFLRYIRKYLQMRWQMSGIYLKIILLGEKGELKKDQQWFDNCWSWVIETEGSLFYSLYFLMCMKFLNKKIKNLE